jgi:hypothetical protein
MRSVVGSAGHRYDLRVGARSSAVELRTFNPGVVGSNPTGPSTILYLELGHKDLKEGLLLEVCRPFVAHQLPDSGLDVLPSVQRDAVLCRTLGTSCPSGLPYPSAWISVVRHAFKDHVLTPSAWAGLGLTRIAINGTHESLRPLGGCPGRPNACSSLSPIRSKTPLFVAESVTVLSFCVDAAGVPLSCSSTFFSPGRRNARASASANRFEGSFSETESFRPFSGGDSVGPSR